MFSEIEKDYNIVDDEDYFQLLLLKKIDPKIKSITKENIKLLFSYYKFYENFTLEDMICLLNLSMSRCNELIKILIYSGLVYQVEKKKFMFIK